MSVKLKFKNVSLVVDTYGQHLAVKMVQVWKGNKFLKNAKINKTLMETLTCNFIEIDGLSIDPDIQELLRAGAKKYKTNVDDYLKFLIEQNNIELQESNKVEKTLLYLMYVEKKRLIDDILLRSLTKINMETIKKVVEKYKEQIDHYNANVNPRLF